MSIKTTREYYTERQEQFVQGFVEKTISSVEARTTGYVVFHFMDGTRVELEAEQGPTGIPMIAFGKNPPADPECAIDELRKMVRNFDSNSETFNQRFSMSQLIQIHRMWMASEWDFYPDQWTEQQVQEALTGHPPQWNEAEEPVLVGSKMIAIIDTNGTENVVWGLGETEEEARQDAAEQENYTPTEWERVCELTDEQVQSVHNGAVAVSSLGGWTAIQVICGPHRRPGR